MRQDIKRIRASRVKAGDTIAFHNPAMDYEVETVSTTKLGQVRFTHGNGTASDCVQPSDFVFIKIPACESAPVESLPSGEFVKRKADSSKVYQRADYDRSLKAYRLDDVSDCCRCIYVKKGTSLFFGFTY